MLVLIYSTWLNTFPYVAILCVNFFFFTQDNAGDSAKEADMSR
jgi:hypothetical protein